MFSFAPCTFNRTTSNCWLIVNFIQGPSEKEKKILESLASAQVRMTPSMATPLAKSSPTLLLPFLTPVHSAGYEHEVPVTLSL